MKNKSFNTKAVAIMLALTLVVGGVVGGTIAWLTAESENVQNVFTTSDISIKLDEAKVNDDGLTLNHEATRVTGAQNFRMIPGWSIAKDPKATVNTGSEDCYLFVKVEETGVSFTPDEEVMPKAYSLDDFVTYSIADGWAQLMNDSTAVTGVYYKVFNSKDTSNTNKQGVAYSILKDDKVTVKDTVTKEMMNDLEKYGVTPKLSFTAYATQYWQNNTTAFKPYDAWQQISATN